MPIINSDSPHIKELAKYEQFHSELTPGGLVPGNPWKMRVFPAMLYRAQEGPGGKYVVAQNAPRRSQFSRDTAGEEQFQSACDEVQRFNDGCQIIVHDEREKQKAFEAGWRATPDDAMKFNEDREKSIADQTARRNHQDKNMSELAKTESDQFERDNFGHQPEIPAKPSLKNYDNPGRSNVAKPSKEHWKTKQKREALEAAAKGGN